MKSIYYLKVSFFLLIMLCMYQPANTFNKPKLVLLPLLGTGLSETETMAYQTALESALLKQYTVFSGSQVIDVLKKQAETLCTAEYCMEQVAIRFQCNKVARGIIELKQNGLYILIVKITRVDTEQHQIIFSEPQVSSSCSVEDVIKKLPGAPGRLPSSVG